jgi:nucleoside-diphosphate-sugar epimerase
MRVLIVGCGYVGLPLGRCLVQEGHEVFGLRRSTSSHTELRTAGIHPLTGDLTRPGDLKSLPSPFDWVVNTVTSTHGGVEDYQKVYLEGMRHLVDWSVAAPPRKVVYTSSTSVYGQTDGSLVREDSATEPESPTSRVLVEAERVLLEAARTRKFPAVILRVAGIYGPERGHLFRQYLRDEAQIPGKGERLMNMIHRDDLVTGIRAALKDGRPGEVYNAADDEPVAQIHFFRWLSETLGKQMPPFAPEEEGAWRKRGLTNKKVSNRRLRMELGVRLQYPTFRQGYTAEITRLERAGELNVNPPERRD